MRTLLQRLVALGLRPPATRALLAAAYVAIAVASLVPKQMRPTSGVVPGAMEHLAAYFVLGVLGAAVLRRRIPWWRLAWINTAWAGALESAQLLVPGRAANVLDFAASAFGSLLGLLAVQAVLRTSAPRRAFCRLLLPLRTRPNRN
jgi:VanZ family protein